MNKSSMVAALNSPAARGATFTAEQVLAIQQALTGGSAQPLPRVQPMVPFGPGIPLVPAPINPVRPDTGRAEPRAYEYPPAFNLPGFGERLVPWKVLRDAGDLISLFRRCIEIRKAEVATLDWDITISAKAVERAQRQDPNSARSDVEKAMRQRVDPHIGRLVDFWEQPDQRNGHDFIAWASKLLEEYFVLDAIAVYPRMRRNGELFGFEILDGTTIKPLLDNDGFRPMPPQPAFQQILYGFPRGEFVADGGPDPDSGVLPGSYPADRLVYKVHNVRSWTPYGCSAVEQALNDGELYARRMGWLKAEYTEGTMPSGWLETGLGQAEWSPQELAQYERELNDYYAGNTVARQRVRILPYGMKPPANRPDLGERYRPDYDLHLIKLVASHFDTTIAELGFTETGGLGSTGWHEGQADVQDRKATQPTLRRLQALCTSLMRTFLAAPPELEFRILGLEAEDEDAADEVSDRRIKRGAMTLNEDRDRTGQPRYAFPEADMPMVDTGRGVVFLEGASQLAPPGVMVGPPNPAQTAGAPTVDEQGNAEQTLQAPPDRPDRPDAAKAELAAYRRWVGRDWRERVGRRFQFTTLSKLDATEAGVDLSLVEFVGKADGEVAGRAPKVRHWPGWERDLAVAEHWASRLESALTGIVSAATLVRQASKVASRGRDAIAAVIARHDWAKPLVRILRGIWTDGYVVGTLSARAVLAHHGLIVKDDMPSTVTLGVDWGNWQPGDEMAAKQILGGEDALGHLLRLVDTGETVADSIVVSRMDRLAGILVDGLERGLAPATIATQLRTVLADRNWAHMVALTETTRAVSSATLVRYGRNGVDAKEWMTALDQRVCSQCAGNEDQGAIPLGSTFPDGNDAPPAHPMCRCSLAPAWLTVQEAAADMGLPLLGLPAFGEGELLAARSAGEILGEEETDAARRAAIRDAMVQDRVRTMRIDAPKREQLRMAQVAASKDVATAVAELDELVDNGVSADAIRSRMVSRGAASNLPPELVTALSSVTDRASADAVISRLETEHKLTRYTPRAGEIQPFKRAEHRMIGGAAQPPEGTLVQVVRPGYEAKIAGKTVRVTDAIVEQLTPKEAAAYKDRGALKLAARERQAAIDTAQKTHDALAGLDELVAKHATKDTLALELDNLAAMKALPAVDLTALRRAAGDPAKLRATIDRISVKRGVTGVTSAGDVTTMREGFDVVGRGTIAPGTEVVVVRRGAEIVHNGETIVLERPQVRLFTRAVQVRPVASVPQFTMPDIPVADLTHIKAIIGNAEGAYPWGITDNPMIQLPYEQRTEQNLSYLQRFQARYPGAYEHLVQQKQLSTSYSEWRQVFRVRGSAADVRRQMVDEMTGQLSDAPIVVARQDEVTLRAILDDGRMKTQFETGTSEGSLAPDLRASYEQSTFGYPQDLDPTLRPVYGYLAPGGVDSAAYERAAVRQYGDISIVLKDSVRDRTSFTVGDSLSGKKEVLPTPVTRPGWQSFNVAPRSGWRAPGGLGRDYASEDLQRSTYVEAQIHGGVRVEDIAEVVFPARYTVRPETIAALKRAGVPWRLAEWA